MAQPPVELAAVAPEAAPVGSAPGVALSVSALRERGAHRSDPAGFRYVEALARRTGAHEGALRQVLEARLTQALAACAERHQAACVAAAHSATALAARFPDAAAELGRTARDGDLHALRRLAARLERPALHSSALAGLVQHIEAQALASGPPAGPAAPRVGPPRAGTLSAAPPLKELKALADARGTWARLSVDRELARSLAQVPENPGPLNSQLLVLRALHVMQAISPAYLDRFVAHTETLMWLDRASLGMASVPVNPVRREVSGKRKSASGRTGPR